VIEQAAIAVFGVVSIWLSQSPDPRQQSWAPIWGLIGQPFWFIATYRAEQWGMFALSIAFTVCWLRGLHTHWFLKGKP
jgi:hypothetical protein